MIRLLLCMIFTGIGLMLHAQPGSGFGDHPYDHARMVNRYGDQMIRGLNQLFTTFGQTEAEEQEKLVREIINQYQVLAPLVQKLEPYRGRDGKAAPDSGMVVGMQQFYKIMELQVIPGLQKIQGKMFKYPPVQTKLEGLPPQQQEVYAVVAEINKAVVNGTQVLIQGQTLFNNRYVTEYNRYPCEKLMYLLQRIEAGNPDTSSRYFDVKPQLERLAASMHRMVYMFGFGPSEAKAQVKPQFEGLVNAFSACLDERWEISRRELTTGHAYLISRKGDGWAGKSSSVWISLSETRPGAGLQYRLDIIY